MSVFDFNNISSSYDDWYQTEFGKLVDTIEKRIFKKFLKKLTSNTVLEIGAGTGHWTQFMSENGFYVLGIDVADKLLEKAKSKNIPFATFINGNVHNLPYNTETIENIVSVTTLEFVKNKNKAFDEIYRVLRKGGGLLVGVLNANGSFAGLREDNDVYRSSSAFTYASLLERLKAFGQPEIEGCALFPEGKNNLHKAEEYEKNASKELLNQKGNFLVGFVQKT